MDKQLIYCTTITEPDRQALEKGVKSIFKTYAFIVKGSTIQSIRITFSTAIKWQLHDIGYQRISNIKPWCYAYSRSKKLYDKLFPQGWEMKQITVSEGKKLKESLEHSNVV